MVRTRATARGARATRARATRARACKRTPPVTKTTTRAPPTVGSSVVVTWTHADGGSGGYLGTVSRILKRKLDGKPVFEVKYPRTAGKSKPSLHTFDDPSVRHLGRLDRAYHKDANETSKADHNGIVAELFAERLPSPIPPVEIVAITNNLADYHDLKQLETMGPGKGNTACHADFIEYCAESAKTALKFDCIYIDVCGTFSEKLIRSAVNAMAAGGGVLAFTFCTRDEHNTPTVGTYDRAMQSIYRHAIAAGYSVVQPADEHGRILNSKTYTDRGSATMSFGIVTLYGEESPLSQMSHVVRVGTPVRYENKGHVPCNGVVARTTGTGAYVIEWEGEDEDEEEPSVSTVRSEQKIRALAQAYRDWACPSGVARALVIDAGSANTTRTIRELVGQP